MISENIEWLYGQLDLPVPEVVICHSIEDFDKLFGGKEVSKYTWSPGWNVDQGSIFGFIRDKIYLDVKDSVDPELYKKLYKGILEPNLSQYHKPLEHKLLTIYISKDYWKPYLILMGELIERGLLDEEKKKNYELFNDKLIECRAGVATKNKLYLLI